MIKVKCHTIINLSKSPRCVASSEPTVDYASSLSLSCDGERKKGDGEERSVINHGFRLWMHRSSNVHQNVVDIYILT